MDRMTDQYGKPMSFGDHLEDLRKRVLLSILGLIPLIVLGFFLGGPLLEILAEPVIEAMRDAGEPSGLLATGPLESFVSYMKVSLGVALLLGLPWVFYQLWLFISPGLYSNERRFVYFLMPLSLLLTVASGAFLYKVLLPISLYFLILFGSNIATSPVETGELPPEITVAMLNDNAMPALEKDPPLADLQPGAQWLNTERNEIRIFLGGDTVRVIRLRSDGLIAQEYRIGEYISLIFSLGIVFAIAFQLPVVMLLLSWVDILRPSVLTPYRRHVGFACAVLGMLLTPQDPWSMILLGSALYMLFEFGLLLMKYVPASVVSGKKTDGNEEA
ncbi:MAG: twin-arginine translocase subunit TatC [Phycisphaerales bacterium JB065]